MASSYISEGYRRQALEFGKLLFPNIQVKAWREENMIIIFDGDTLKLLDDLEQFSGKSQKLTLDFMLANFKILSREELQDATITRPITES